ncbi:MAG: DUF488 family protein [Gammaproteobacteria bacterium]
MKIFTIGFTKTTAEHFFTRLEQSGARKLIDVRLNNVSQLSGFAKRDDLRYFSETICAIGYEHLRAFAPTQELLDRYKKRDHDWAAYERDFLGLMQQRRIESMSPEALDGGCLLCSEDTPHHCHRRLVAEYLKRCWPDVQIVHL